MAKICVSLCAASVFALANFYPFTVEPFVPGPELPAILSHHPTAEKHLIETMPGGVAMLDYDNDGLLDIFLANGANQANLNEKGKLDFNRLYRQLPSGGFEDVTTKAGVQGEGYSMGVAVADYNGDGSVDIFVTGVHRNLLYRNNGNGTFALQPFPSTGWSVAAGWFDYDRDGDLDLFLVNYVKYDRAAEPFCGDIKAGYRTYCHPKYYDAAANNLFRNDGGKFTDVSAASGIARYLGKGMSLAFADFDRDGFPDVFVTNDTVPNFLLRNLGNGTFKDVAVEAGVAVNDDGLALSSMGVDFRDYDNDGLPDIFVTALANETFPLYRALRGGLFADVTYSSKIGVATRPLSGWSTGIFDFNNDGWKDIFTANGDVNDNTDLFSNRKSKQQSYVLWNEGGKTFRPESFGPMAQHRGAAFGDINRDGAVDVVVTRLGQPPLIWLNQAARGNHWLIVKAPLGSEVHLKAGDQEQWNTVTQAVGYASSSAPIAHFGLGSATSVDVLEVQFPSGVRKSLRKIAADRYLTVEP